MRVGVGVGVCTNSNIFPNMLSPNDQYVQVERLHRPVTVCKHLSTVLRKT